MAKINVHMADGSDQVVHENDQGAFDLLCPCGATLPMMPNAGLAAGIPLMCPCGRQYDGSSDEPGEVPSDYWEAPPGR